jgi:Delta7-sterol 5-desaturase
MDLFFKYSVGNFFIFLVRYIIIAGLFFFVVYIWKHRELLSRKIQKLFPKPTDYQREILFSFQTLVIFWCVGGIFLGTSVRDTTLIYSDILQYWWVYFWGSVLLLIVYNDAYFYWMHRTIHHPRIMKHVHTVHHLSHNPSPWAAFSFHPIESVLEAGVLITAVYIFPLHPMAVFFFGTWMTFFNVLVHTGYDILPFWNQKHWFWKWWNSPRDHNLHHSSGKWNYGLYFRFWDKMMGTYVERSSKEV